MHGQRSEEGLYGLVQLGGLHVKALEQAASTQQAVRPRLTAAVGAPCCFGAACGSFVSCEQV
jgi:hypothetical protein